MSDRPNYDRALAALQSAYDACYKHPERNSLGMSIGPFSGVNVALGIVAMLERENTELKAQVAKLKAQLGGDQ